MRTLLIGTGLLALLVTTVHGESAQATGVKVGEGTPDSAIVWVRFTAAARRVDSPDIGKNDPKVVADKLQGACPGRAGQVRVRYGLKGDLSDAVATDWINVNEKTDFAHAFQLDRLRPATVYHFATETRVPGEAKTFEPLRGRFETAPPTDRQADTTFTVITGQAYKDLDHADGFHIYPAMQKLRPKFLVPTGDTVYYDNDSPMARTPALARLHWQRMYSLPRHLDFHLNVPAYWEKDDHDTLFNDCWPGRRSAAVAPLTFADGLRIYAEQVPQGAKPYRTFRWGKNLQVWLVEGRDFRSPNTMKDGPEKTIWGAEQKKWLFDTMKASDADWKVLISPTPIVGPDRARGKNDNHANDAFQTEGDEVRSWLRKNLPDTAFVVCGDRHWQYHSIHPETKVHEFSCGPASDRHAGGSPGLNKEYHQFHRVKGGFLSVRAHVVEGKSTITFRFHDVDGKVVHEYSRSR